MGNGEAVCWVLRFHAFTPSMNVAMRQEAFNMLTVENPSPEVLKQRHCMEYIWRSVLEGPGPKDKSNLQRLRLLVHGPGGCGKSVVTRAAAHMLRQIERGVVLAAPTGVAAQNQSYGKVCDLPLPRGEQLACKASGNTWTSSWWMR